MSYNPFVERRARVKVQVTRPDNAGQQAQHSFTFEQHRMRIGLRQGGKQYGNAKVEIFGVPLSSMNQIARLWMETLTPQNDDTLAIDVWDGQDFVPLFQGVITWSAVDASGMPQVKLVIEANASMILMNTTASPYASGTGPVALPDALTSIIKPQGFSLDYSDTATRYPLTDVHVSGSPLEQVSTLMRHYDELTWFCNLQRLIVRRAKAPFNEDAIRIAADTGLQGFPVYSSSGLQLSTVFNARLRPGAPLDVQVNDFDFINRTSWVAAVVAHQLDVNVPSGAWATGLAANAFGSRGNGQN